MATVPRDWAAPFLEQARADLRAAWKVPADVCPSTLCMLLQMVFEKLAKAAFAQQNMVVPQSHQAASRLFGVLQLGRRGGATLQVPPNVRQFVAELELAQPSIAKRQPQQIPQLEYPWEDAASGVVLYPERDLPLAKRISSPKDRTVIDCMRFASQLAKDFYTIFP